MGRKPYIERNALIVELKDKKGKSYRQIGKIFDLSVKTVWEIYGREKERTLKVGQK